MAQVSQTEERRWLTREHFIHFFVDSRGFTVVEAAAAWQAALDDPNEQKDQGGPQGRTRVLVLVNVCVTSTQQPQP